MKKIYSAPILDKIMLDTASFLDDSGEVGFGSIGDRCVSDDFGDAYGKTF